MNQLNGRHRADKMVELNFLFNGGLNNQSCLNWIQLTYSKITEWKKTVYLEKYCKISDITRN